MGIQTVELPVETKNNSYHYPVMYREILDLVKPAGRKVVVDCTFGMGALSSKILEVMGQDSFLVGIDRDEESLKLSAGRLNAYSGRFTLVKDNFSNIAQILKRLDIKAADAVIFDLGISSFQLNSPQRGFSFLKDGPLDMRMDKDSFISACDLVNNLSEEELANIFYKFGEERFGRRIARFVVEARRNEPIVSTFQLAETVVDAVCGRNRNFRVHPATRVFQALRIATNTELESLRGGLEAAIGSLAKGGRIAVVSFHSLEDRIVKHTFKEFAGKGFLDIVTKKPLQPDEQELTENNPSRSAKLRVAQRI